VVIANRGRAVVRLVKIEAPKARRWGAWEGLMSEEEIDHAFSPEVEGSSPVNGRPASTGPSMPA
jgi:antitoxin (DNA-binding transcriptional repressor) of toxin-antitoxin stability system